MSTNCTKPVVQRKHSCPQRKHTHEQVNITLCGKVYNRYRGEGVVTSNRKWSQRHKKKGGTVFILGLEG